DVAELLDDLRDALAAKFGVADVPLEEQAAPPGRLDGRARLLGVPIVGEVQNRDVCPFARVQNRDGPPDPRVASRDHGDPSLQLSRGAVAARVVTGPGLKLVLRSRSLEVLLGEGRLGFFDGPRRRANVLNGC